MATDDSVKYLSANGQDAKWGSTVSTVGHQRIKPHSPYPSSNHPFNYSFTPDNGRILADEYQLIYIHEGQGSFVSAHKESTRIHSGQMIILFPGEWHSYCPDIRTGWHEYWIGFSGRHIDSLLRAGFFALDEPVVTTGFSGDIVMLYEQALRIAQNQSIGSQQILSGIVHLLLGYAYSRSRSAGIVNVGATRQINKAKDIIMDNYKTNLSPADVAAMVNMSYSWFRKMFKVYTGMSPFQYKENLRIQRSKDLLANTDKTSQEIAFEVGFNTPYHFCIVFRRHTGYSPLDFRRMFR